MNTNLQAEKFRLGFEPLIRPDQYGELTEQIIEIKRMLTVLVQKLNADSWLLIARGQPNPQLWLRPQAALCGTNGIVDVCRPPILSPYIPLMSTSKGPQAGRGNASMFCGSFTNPFTAKKNS